MIHKFIEFVPTELENDVLYISIDYCTAIHKCCCGCGKEVVTPISPTGWKITFDGESISLYPSIGNWSFPCQSHYWIKNDKIVWATKWSQDEINVGRQLEKSEKMKYFENKKAALHIKNKKELNLWSRIKIWLSGFSKR